MAVKVLQCGFYWQSLLDTNAFASRCDKCQRVGNISKRYEMPKMFLEVELFYVWDIDFMRHFSLSIQK